MINVKSLVAKQLESLLEEEKNVVTNLANASALIFQSYENVNWAGFYIYNSETNELDLGPFQGNVACMHIKPGSGVVGTAFEKKTSIIVPDVHGFAGHIACDANSKSELVVPLFKNDEIYGVIDIDSPSLDRFSSVEQEEIEELAVVLSEHV